MSAVRIAPVVWSQCQKPQKYLKITTPNTSTPPHHLFFSIEKDDTMGFGVPLNFLWPCLHYDEQWVVVSGALNVQDAHDFCFKAAHASVWSIQDLKFTQVFLPSLSSSKLVYMFSESQPILILHLHLLNPRLYPGPCSPSSTPFSFLSQVLQGGGVEQTKQL